MGHITIKFKVVLHPNQKLACFVLYLKNINALRKNNIIMHLIGTAIVRHQVNNSHFEYRIHTDLPKIIQGTQK